jgi:hypothetical protein
MPRPDSHRYQQHEKCCGNCKFSHLVAYKLDLLCFYGDTIRVIGKSEYPVTADLIQMNGEEVGMMDGEEYSSVWAGRIIDGDDVCDKWEAAE